MGDDAKGLRIMIKSAIRLHTSGQCIFAAMPKGRMPQIMRQRETFGQIFIKAQNPRNRARDLRDFETMGQARAVIIPLMGDKDLGFAFQAAKGGRMDNPVFIPLKRATL